MVTHFACVVTGMLPALGRPAPQDNRIRDDTLGLGIRRTAEPDVGRDAARLIAGEPHDDDLVDRACEHLPRENRVANPVADRGDGGVEIELAAIPGDGPGGLPAQVKVTQRLVASDQAG